MSNVKEVLDKQRLFYETGKTKEMNYRIENLKLLYKAIQKYENEIMEALKLDLNKAFFEGYATEIGMVLEEISFMLKYMEGLLRVKKVRTPLAQFPSVSKIYKEPYGNVLIIAPWNYPFLLSISPLVGAIACGNCAIVKPSNAARATSSLIKKIIANTFDEAYITVIEGGREANQSLLDNKFDFIFFTGSKHVGKIVMEKAAQNLTPVALELGGKSPCIIDKTAGIKMAGKRIIWGKGINAGQTCVAPDYLLVHKDIKVELINELKKNSEVLFGSRPEENLEFPKIINKKHFNRLNGLIETGEIIYGGKANAKTNQIGLTLMDNVGWDDPIMQEEIFGPILPIIVYEDLNEIISLINRRPKPLALYLFTKSKEIERKIIEEVSYGGGCINDTIVHLATSYMGFGGVGESGMGSYHGKASIDTFSHSKSVLKKSNFIDIPVRYPPYGKKLNLLKKIMK
ncbi:aldehyde dehydrogenase [Tissierella creatinophila]|uniref:Aldehyde dehydrogenase n=1 Tax=Tissierella creatinophila DSM 6911 TaxID=1123403 RepID=A0A1U7M3M7_TISCR|nr:aldehyde dehydrogenase [Tissierella creatinophila]OLS01917.1 NAD(P)-dependent benzaldehyde dehydrogenase [Tissierella creatinophila DSM 6911]